MAVELSFGERMRRVREHAGFTQEEMAVAVRVTRASWNYYEKNKAKVSAEKFMPIARKVALDLEALYFALGLNDDHAAAQRFYAWWDQTAHLRSRALVQDFMPASGSHYQGADEADYQSETSVTLPSNRPVGSDSHWLESFATSGMR